jgi:hypothetical protein
VIALVGVLLFFEVGVKEVGTADGTSTVVIETANVSPIRWVGWCSRPSREKAEAVLNGPYRELVGEVYETKAPAASDRSFVLKSNATTIHSPYGIWRDEYIYQRWVVIVVEFADGSRWAKLEDRPNPASSPTFTCRIEEGRLLRPAK